MVSRFDLVIFDCDGVLVDSEKIANTVFAQIIKDELGLVLSLDTMLATFLGKSASQCLSVLEQMVGHKLPPQVGQRYDEDIQAALAEKLSPVAGVSALLEMFKKASIPYCVASSGSHEKMQTTLGKTALIHHFSDNIYSTSDVQRGKPFPDVYLYAAQKMGGYNPSQCLVIEDSPLGVKGAVSAGMTVFGYAELTNKTDLTRAGAHRVFDNMDMLLRDSHSFFSY